MPTAIDSNASFLADIERELERSIDPQASPSDVLRQFLVVVLPHLAATGAEVWTLSQQGLLASLAACGEPMDATADAALKRQRIQRLLATLHCGEPVVHCQPAAGGDAQPKHFFMAPLIFDGNAVGVVEAISTGGHSEEDSAKQLRLLAKLTDWVSARLEKRTRSDSSAERMEFFRQVEQFVLRLHTQETSLDVARVAANETRRLLGCDRASVATRHGNSAQVLAVSGQDRVVHRANATRALEGLATLALASRRSLTYFGDLDGQAPKVKEALADYLSECGAVGLVCIPLSPFVPDADLPQAEGRGEAEPEVNGVLIIEYLRPDCAIASDERVDQLALHIGQALSKARDSERTFLVPLRKKIGAMAAWAVGDNWRKCALAALIVLGLIASLALTPAPSRVTARGVLLPSTQRRVFAPDNAEIVEVLVQDGQRVTPEQPLMRLKNDELSLRILTMQNELREKQQLLGAYEAQEDTVRRNAPLADQIRLRGRITQTRIEIDSLAKQLGALTRQHDQLTVRADVHGVVATFRPKNLLVGRPVQRGRLLMELVDPDGPWQLELETSANRIGRILDAQRALQDRRLPVEFVLATSPEQSYRGRIVQMASRTKSNVKQVHVVELVAEVEPLSNPVVGADVVARIDCGQTNLGYALFGDAIDAVRRYFW